MYLKKIILLLTIFLIFTSCKKTTSPKNTVNINTEKPIDKVAFDGVWSRNFSMGNAVSATVTYEVFKDSIQYNMVGPMALKYAIIKDNSNTKKDRWIGNKGATPYVIFIKDLSSKSVTLLKMKTKSIEEAINMKFPSDSARSKFSSWNVYQKQ